MRLLVGATCIAIIAAVGYYFWGEYSRHLAATAAENSRQAAVEAERKQQDLDDLEVIRNGVACRSLTQIAVSINGDLTAMDATSHRRLRLCVTSGAIWPFDRGELERIGLIEKLLAG